MELNCNVNPILMLAMFDGNERRVCETRVPSSNLGASTNMGCSTHHASANYRLSSMVEQRSPKPFMWVRFLQPVPNRSKK